MDTSAGFQDEIKALRAKLSDEEKAEFDCLEPARRDRFLWELKEKEARLRIYSGQRVICCIPKELELGVRVSLAECRIMDSEFHVRALRMKPHHEVMSEMKDYRDLD
jgi:nicotinic acid phosphoribosyltransferase